MVSLAVSHASMIGGMCVPGLADDLALPFLALAFAVHV